MRYVALLYWEEDRRPTPASPDFDDILAEYAEVNRSMKAAGDYVLASPLENVAEAISVRVRDGQTGVTDGPFAETKERLGGFYLMDVAGLEEAVAYARRIPAARYGKVELRPVNGVALADV